MEDEHVVAIQTPVMLTSGDYKAGRTVARRSETELPVALGPTATLVTAGVDPDTGEASSTSISAAEETRRRTVALAGVLIDLRLLSSHLHASCWQECGIHPSSIGD
jgi:hypothetical protein